MNFYPRDDLPKPLVDALIDGNRKYSEDLAEHLNNVEGNYDFQISVTSLPQSPRQLQLKKRHLKDVTVDPLKESFFTLQGSIIHYVLESYAGSDRYVRETRLGKILDIDGVKVYFHGQLDLYDKETQTLTDWKYTSARSMMYPKDDYEYQLNALRWLAWQNPAFPYHIRNLQDVYLFRHLDALWKTNPLYPKENALVVPVEKKSQQVIEGYIKERLRIHLNEVHTPNDALPFCSDEERWIRDSQWRVYTKTKKGDRFKQTASFKGTKEEVDIAIKQANLSVGDYELKEFKGAAVKCEGFCPIRGFCNQYIQERNNKDNE